MEIVRNPISELENLGDVVVDAIDRHADELNDLLNKVVAALDRLTAATIVHATLNAIDSVDNSNSVLEATEFVADQIEAIRDRS